MAGAKPTPGPWKRRGIVVLAASEPVAECLPMDWSYKAAEANARLIALAPDMYKELLGILTLYSQRLPKETIERIRGVLRRIEEGE
jgi:hypothetical protein